MKSISRILGVALMGVFCVALMQTPTVEGQDKGKNNGKKIESKAEQRTPATSVNFAKELGIAFPCFTGLGARIESARDQGDPVGLASAAKELAAGEKASGKQAAIKAADLLKEAIEMGKRRFDGAELRALAFLANEKNSEELLGMAKKADEAAAVAKKDRETGVKSRGIMGTLHADSRVNATISVYVNGYYRGTMGPWGDIYPYIGHGPYDSTFLEARSSDGRYWSRVVSAPYTDYQWILYP